MLRRETSGALEPRCRRSDIADVETCTSGTLEVNCMRVDVEVQRKFLEFWRRADVEVLLEVEARCKLSLSNTLRATTTQRSEAMLQKT